MWYINEMSARTVFTTNNEWTLIPTPMGTSQDAKLCAKQEEWLRDKHPALRRHQAVIRAKGNGTVIVDLERIHWIPNPNDGTPLKLQVALLDGEGVVAHWEFERLWRDGLESVHKTDSLR